MNPADTLRLIDSFETLSRLPRNVRTRLAEMADGHPRTVEFLDTLVTEQRRSLGLGVDISDPWTQLIQPVLGKHAEKISSDLLLENLWERLSPAAREHAGRLSILRISAPRFVLDRLGSAADELIRSSVLTLYRERAIEDGEPVWLDRWGLQSLVKEFIGGKLTEAERREAHSAAGAAYEEWVKQPRAWWNDQVEEIHHFHSVRAGDRAWPLVQEYVIWLRGRARYREALALLEMCEGVGTSGDNLARALIFAAHMRRRLGERPSELSGLLERARSLAGSDETRSLVLHELGSLRNAQGAYVEAEALHRESLALRKKVFGTGHPEYGASLHALAGVLQSQGKYVEAEGLLREALALKEKVLGTSHSSYGVSLHALAAVLQSQGKSVEAEGLLREALALTEKVLGTGHPSYGASLHELARVLQSQGKYVEAEGHFREALALTEKVLGTGHPSLCPTLANLANVLAQQGKAAEGEPLVQRALEISRRVFEPVSPDTAQILNRLAQLQDVLNRPEAADTARQALETLVVTLGADHPVTQSEAPILQRIASGGPASPADQIQSLAD